MSNDETVCEGDQGGPAVYQMGNLEYLGGIATFDLPKTSLYGRLPPPRYFCGAYSKEPTLPAKYVKIFYFVNWLLRDHNQPDKPVRMEVFDCLVKPQNPKTPKPLSGEI